MKKFEENAERQSSWHRRDNSRNVESRHRIVSNRATRLIENLRQRNCTIRLEEQSNLDHCEGRQSSNLRQLKGCSVLPTESKLLGTILIDKLITEVDEKLRPEQAGFRKGRGTTEVRITSLNGVLNGRQGCLAGERIWQILRGHGNQKSLYALLGAGTTTIKVQSSVKEASQIGLKSPQALSRVVCCQDLFSSLYLTG